MSGLYVVRIIGVDGLGGAAVSKVASMEEMHLIYQATKDYWAGDELDEDSR